MKKLVLITFVVFNLFVQNTVLAADVHMGHQDGTEHKEFNHEHGLELEAAIDIASAESDVVDFDCHHCCHCHGSTSSSILSNQETTLVLSESPQLGASSLNVTPGVLFIPLRPPIS